MGYFRPNARKGAVVSVLPKLSWPICYGPLNHPCKNDYYGLFLGLEARPVPQPWHKNVELLRKSSPALVC